MKIVVVSDISFLTVFESSHFGSNNDRHHINGYNIVGGLLGTEVFDFIFAPDSNSVEPVNTAIESMRVNGTLNGLKQKCFFDYNRVNRLPRVLGLICDSYFLKLLKG